VDNREIFERRLAVTERRISELEQHVARQRNVVAWLEASGRGSSETAEIARERLLIMERNVGRETAERRLLRRQLGR